MTKVESEDQEAVKATPKPKRLPKQEPKATLSKVESEDQQGDKVTPKFKCATFLKFYA